ncbi:MAG: RES family NAD+ phosphorylase, partial [Pararheinheimera sp.]|nr:RES family NAD+ phosphorylase [Rheinheimera sp.]
LKILDFSVNHGQRSFNLNLLSGKASPDEIDKAVWSDIDNAFSQPTKASDIKSEYAPTQIISELIRSQGFDGIAYKSSLGEGYNICLFELDVADVIDCSIFEPTSMKFEFKKVNEY